MEELTGSVLEAARATDDRRIQIPATLRDALSERLDRLGSAKEVAQIAAAFGREFAADLVAATLERPEADLAGRSRPAGGDQRGVPEFALGPPLHVSATPSSRRRPTKAC